VIVLTIVAIYDGRKEENDGCYGLEMTEHIMRKNTQSLGSMKRRMVIEPPPTLTQTDRTIRRKGHTQQQR
jgi:hypothetical protein